MTDQSHCMVSRVLGVASALAVGAALLLGNGCQLFSAVGAMAQSAEYQKLIEVLPKYDDLAGKSFAVLVETDMAVQYENAGLSRWMTSAITDRIAREVPASRPLPPNYILDWQYRTRQWEAMTYGEMADQLNVDRIIHVDLIEYRLNPPGNRYEWQGVIGARVNIAERDGLDPDVALDTLTVDARFPIETGVGAETMSKNFVETVLLNDFVKRVSWLFYQHLEPKYPDKYRPELNPDSKRMN